jgi:type I restriction enzyme S subunit
MSNRLPDNWTLTSLGDVRQDTSKSLNPKNHPDQLFELYSVPSHEENEPEVARGKDIGSSKKLVTPNTVLVCKINPRINRVWIVGNRTPHQKLASTEWISFGEAEGINPSYLRYYMQQSSFRDYLAANVSGVGGSLMRTNSRTVDAYPLPLAPIAEQARIVEKIEELFTKLDAGVCYMGAVKALLQSYRQAVLKAAVEGELTREWRESHPDVAPGAESVTEHSDSKQRSSMASNNRLPQPSTPNLPMLPATWTWATFEQVSERVTVGHVGPMKDEYTDSGIPFLRSMNVRANKLERSGLKFVSQEFHERLAKSKLKAGDLVVVRSGSVGTACVIPDSLGPANCSDLVIVKRPRVLNPYFAAYYMNSVAKSMVKRRQVGIALTHFNTKSMAALPVPVPPTEEQEVIVEEVERRLSVIASVEAQVGLQLRHSDRLRQAVLKQAFSGTLVSRASATTHGKFFSEATAEAI